MIIKIKNEELKHQLVGETKNFPKYVTQLLNTANANVQGTRPTVVGQLSELIKECPYNTYDGWRKWYLSKYPNAINEATRKVASMVSNIKEAIGKIDGNMIKNWVEDLVLVKTFVGLKFQEVILKRVSTIVKKSYRLARPDEESKGIDGFIGNTPISVKPTTYKLEKKLGEKIDVEIIYYEKLKDGIKFEIDEKLITRLSQS